MARETISAQDVIKEFNITYQKLNHYTNLDLLEVVERRGNARLYNYDQIRERLQLIQNLMQEGYPLRLIRKKISGETDMAA